MCVNLPHQQWASLQVTVRNSFNPQFVPSDFMHFQDSVCLIKVKYAAKNSVSGDDPYKFVTQPRPRYKSHPRFLFSVRGKRTFSLYATP